jgi:hypothetical protein
MLGVGVKNLYFVHNKFNNGPDNPDDAKKSYLYLHLLLKIRAFT